MRAQRGRRADPAEQRIHDAVPQQVHVLDAVRPAGHPGDQAGRPSAGALTPHGPPGRTCSATSSVSPARWASAMTGTSPARDTRFGSSNDACVLARLCNNRT